MWIDNFTYNPLVPLTEYPDQAVALTARRDLLDERISAEILWQLPMPLKILRKQRSNGSWDYPGAKERIRSKENYNQIETYRNLGFLIEEYGFTKAHPAIKNAAEYLFTFQTEEGDFRGIYGNQYTPNYSAGILELLLKAGYIRDKRIEKGLDWLLSMRQSDGGWAIPLRTRNYALNIISSDAEAIQPDVSKVSSHLITGVVLRAFAAHPSYKKNPKVKQAGDLLLAGLFKKDNYPDRASADFWLRFTFPFWFTDLISALDTLSQLSISKQEPRIKKALHWFVANQKSDGMWDIRITKGENKEVIQAWLCLAICRIFKRLDDGNKNI